MEWLGINQSASATHQPHEILYFLFYHLGPRSRLDQKDGHNWSRIDHLTALESQTMTFKSFDVDAKAVCCHKSEVLAVFSARFFCNGNFKHCKSYKVDSFLYRFFFIFKLQRIITECYLVIFAVRCWKLRGGRP